MSLTMPLSRHATPVLAALLLAVAFVLHIGTVSAAPLSGDTVAPASVSGGGCCDSQAQSGCSDPAMQEAIDSCTRHCAQSGHSVPSQGAVPGFSVPVCAAEVHARKLKFSPYRPVLAAAPPAISSTPLIYHLQRLLN